MIKNTILAEAKALQAAADFLDDKALETVLAVLADCKGRLVCTGVGKSAHIARKMAATCSSTGTPAAFMHAADALHGDLGMVGKDDVVICFSKSGSSAELRQLLPLLVENCATLVAITANPNGDLARWAHHSLLLPNLPEADADDLAPTTSTAMQMALADGIAISLAHQNGFGSQDFAKLHPAGALGRRLHLRLADLLSTEIAPPRVPPSASLSEVIMEISSKRLGATAVIDQNDNLLGIITDGDLRRFLGQHGLQGADVIASQLMSAYPKTLPAHTLAFEALDTLRSHKIGQVMVLGDASEYLGMVHLHQLLQML